MKSKELIRKLIALGATVETGRGKGGHVLVILGEKSTVIPTSTKELPKGTFHGILKQLGVSPADL